MKSLTYEGPLGYSRLTKIHSQFLMKQIEKSCSQIQNKLLEMDLILIKAKYYFKSCSSKLYLINATNL